MRLRRAWALLLAIAAVPVLAWAQQPATISGRVTDQAGNPVPAAQVFIAELNVGTVTGQDGTYRLTVPAARIRAGAVTLTVSRTGYQQQSVTLTLQPGASLTRNFTLATAVVQLGELVAVGPAAIQTTRERLASTVNTVRSEEIERSKETNVISALAGKAPNVFVQTSAGDPGSGAYIQIRGAASVFGGTQPLIVVDGTPIDNSTVRTEANTAGTVATNRAFDINPADIERIDILKGAAATAIYGARGANGVVIITTKSGRAGATRATLSTNYSIDDVNKVVPLQRSYGQGSLGRPSGTSSFSWGPKLDPNTTPIYDHAREIYRTGHRWETNLTLSGGSEKTTYYLSLGRLDHQGVIVGPQGYTRTTVRLKGSQFFTDKLQIGGNIAYTQGKGDFVQQGSNISGIQLAALRTPPDFNNLPYKDPATGLHRSYRCNEIGRVCPGGGSFFSVTSRRGYDNPFWVAYEIRNLTDVGRAFGNVSVDYTPLSWLKVSYVLGADYWSDERLNLFPKSSSDFPDGRLIRANFVKWLLDSNLLLTATGDLLRGVSGTLTLGQNLNQEVYRGNQVNGTTLILGTEETDFAVTLVGDEYKYRIRNDGYFATGELNLGDLLTLNATARYDGSSTFGGNKRFFYPGLGAKLTLSNLPALRNLGWLSYGALRASYGVSGLQPPAFSNVNAFVTGYFGDGWLNTGLYSIYRGQEGVFPDNTRGNPNIKPEKRSETEVGLDLGLFDQRVALGVTYYKRRTRDAILTVNLPPSTGFFNEFRNAARFENHGWEMTLDLVPVRTQRFSWTLNAQWARNRSCVEDIAGTESIFLGGFEGANVSLVAPERDANGRITKCYQFGVLFGDDFVRYGRGSVDQNTGRPIDPAMAQYGARPGDIYIGADGYPQLDPQERVIGDPNPKWTGSLRSTFTLFNNLTISGLIDVKKGGDMWNGTKGALYFFGTHKDTEPYHGDGQVMTYAQYSGKRVAGPGANKAVTFDQLWFVSNIGSGFTGPSSQFVEDASYVKLRDVSISYTFRQPWVRRLGFASLDLTVSGRNLKTWTNYTGIDPESNLLGQTAARGMDYFNNPQTRSFVFTVNLNR